MKQNIKYRAWLKNVEEMCEVVGFNFIYETATVICKDRSTIYMSGEQPLMHKIFKFDKVELMQFTGLVDKNDKQIFEGDIIEVNHSYKDRYYKGEIIFENGAFEAKEFYFSHYDNPSDFKEGLEYVEVIGNIYENKSLLEDAK